MSNVVRAFAAAPELEAEGRLTMITHAEDFLARVKSGHVTSFAIATIQKDSGVGSVWSCPFDNPVAILGALEVAKQRIVEANGFAGHNQ